MARIISKKQKQKQKQNKNNTTTTNNNKNDVDKCEFDSSFSASDSYSMEYTAGAVMNWVVEHNSYLKWNESCSLPVPFGRLKPDLILQHI